MRDPRLVLAVLCLLGALFFFRSQPPPEPQWQEYTFTHWLGVSESQDPYIAAHGKHALEQIGHQAVPFLLHEISLKDSKMMESINEFLRKIPGDFQLPDDSDEYSERLAAVHGFEALGSSAKAAVPRLEELLFDQEISYPVATALAAVGGQESLPVFCAALTNANANICVAALEALCSLGTNAEPALPILLQLSSATQPNTQLYALYCLGKIGRNQPAQVVPVLHNSLKILPRSNLLTPLLSLGELGPAAMPAVPEILDLLTNKAYTNLSDRIWRKQAAVTLVKIMEKEAIPHLLGLVTNENLPVAAMAIRELGDLGTNAASVVPLLVSFATNQTEYVAASAIYSLGRIKSHPELVVPVLIQNLTHTNEIVAVRSAVTLALFGTDAQAAVPLLTTLATTRRFSNSYGPDNWILEELGLPRNQYHEPLRFALKQIDPKAAAAIPHQ